MTKDAIKPISTHREVLQQALEALNLPSMKTQQMLIQRDEAIDALRNMLSQEHALYELARLGQELQPEPLAQLRRLHHNNVVLKNALWKACGDDGEVVNATIESQGELK